MNTLKFDILPSPESGDHQVRILVDGEDWLGAEVLGIDPPEFFAQGSLLGGSLLVGRCNCGVVGCGDFRVDVVRDGDRISWTSAAVKRLDFDFSDYSSLISRTAADLSWEDVNRRAEAAVNGEFLGTTLAGGYVFEWASARVRPGVMTLSFSLDRRQTLLEFPWNGRSAEDALAAAKAFRAELLSRPPAMRCSRCGLERIDLAEDLEFAVLDVEDYKRILILGTGRPEGGRWEIEGWKVSEAGRYRSGVCADCAKTIRPLLRKKRLVMTGAGLGILGLSPLAISLTDKMPVVGLIGGWFVLPIAGLITLIMAYQLNKKINAFDEFHRKAWAFGGGKVLHASYGLLPRQKGVQMRFLLKDWEQLRASYEEERRESGWSHFIAVLHKSLSSDQQPAKREILEAFGAKHMGEIMDRHPHKKR